ncbi:hypothetical protein, partial [Fulvivirga sediminis]
MKRMSLPILLSFILALVSPLAYAQISVVKEGLLPRITDYSEQSLKVTKTDEALYFSFYVLNDPANGFNENIIRTDGSEQGTYVIEQMSGDNLVSIGNDIYFESGFNGSGNIIFKSNGKPFSATEHVVLDDDDYVYRLISGGDEILAETFSPLLSFDKNGNITDYGVWYSFSGQYFHFNDQVFLQGREGDGDYKVYSYSENGLRVVTEVPNLNYVYSLDYFGSIESDVYYFPTILNDTYSDWGHYNTEIWKLKENGYEKITALADDLLSYEHTGAGSKLFFKLKDLNDDSEYGTYFKGIWQTDGTAAGTKPFLFKDYDMLGGDSKLYLNNGTSYDPSTQKFEKIPGLSGLTSLYQSGDQLFYFRNAGNNTALWTTDGTVAGSHKILDQKNLSLNNVTDVLGIYDGYLMFIARSPEGVIELYKSPLGVTKVVEFNQGKKNNGMKISSDRSYSGNVIGNPQENNRLNFVSLGFGGSITLELASKVFDDGSAEPDMILVETSYGRADQMCFSNGNTYYPEQAYVEVSADGKEWYSLPNSYCRTSFLDIKPAVDSGMKYAKYIRITDASDRSAFDGSADGFDVDGIIINRAAVEQAKATLTNARVATVSGANLFNADFFNTLPNEEDESSNDVSALKAYPNPITQGLVTLSVSMDVAQKGS